MAVLALFLPPPKFLDGYNFDSFADDYSVKNIHNVPLDSEDNNEDEQRRAKSFDGKLVVDPISGGATIL